MADPRQVEQWLSGLEKERSSKIGETSGVGDLLTALGLLKQPLAAGAFQGADLLDRISPPKKARNPSPEQKKMLMGIEAAPQQLAVVSPAVKKQRAAAISALSNANTAKKSRIDMIPEKLMNYSGISTRRDRYLNKSSDKGFPYFFNEDTPGAKLVEVLVNNKPKSGLTINKNTPRDRQMVEVDAAPRDPGGKVDPAAVKQITRALAAFNPNKPLAGGMRDNTGMRGRLGTTDRLAEVVLPKLSEMQAMKERQQVMKWLDEKISSRKAR